MGGEVGDDPPIMQCVRSFSKRNRNVDSKPFFHDIHRMSRLILFVNPTCFSCSSNGALILIFQDPGVIVLFGPSGGGGTEDATADFDEEQEESEGESSSDSECDVNRPVSPCKFTFVGANAGAGKSSLRGGQLKRKKVGRSVWD